MDIPRGFSSERVDNQPLRYSLREAPARLRSTLAQASAHGGTLDGGPPIRRKEGRILLDRVSQAAFGDFTCVPKQLG